VPRVLGSVSRAFSRERRLQEEIEAKRELSGNFMAMQLLLDCMRRRERWPEQFITALEACEHSAMAGAVRDEYDRLRAPCGRSTGGLGGGSPWGALILKVHY